MGEFRASLAMKKRGSGRQRAGERARLIRGQSAVEYALLAAVLVGALLAMQIYVKRGAMGRLKEAADQIGEQYAPRSATSNLTMTISSNTTTTSTLRKDQDLGRGQTGDVMVTTTTINQDTTTRTGSESVGPLGTDLWE